MFKKCPFARICVYVDCNFCSVVWIWYSGCVFCFFFLLVMFSPFPSSSRRSPACLRKMRIWFFPFSMFCAHLPRLLWSCMMKHSPTSTKVSIRVLQNLFMVGQWVSSVKKELLASYQLLSSVLVVLVFEFPTFSEFSLLLEWKQIIYVNHNLIPL